MSLEIRHDRCAARFTAEKDGAEVGELTYVIDDGTMNINHTFVNPDQRGQGIATKMTDAAEAFARAEGLKVIATCSYAAAKIAEK
ncbi:putative acetyltransferase [Thermoplasmatales archaeon BRNA1]|nr:putative acetyltransferase [Thermoplasmatales archaeon BRNA1]